MKKQRNPIAQDLRTPKYRNRIVRNKKKEIDRKKPIVNVVDPKQSE